MRNVSLTINSLPDEQNFLQIYGQNDSLILRTMNIPERTGMCDITIQGYKTLANDINVALDSQ